MLRAAADSVYSNLSPQLHNSSEDPQAKVNFPGHVREMQISAYTVPSILANGTEKHCMFEEYSFEPASC